MNKYGLNDLREMFLSFFEEKEHLRLPGFSLVPRDDASLLLINSGMAPMKTWFTGEQKPPSRRVCTCQKCIRTGDIESVGKTSRHGTYFEMLGNFSFGDYFKNDAIVWCWEFLTKRICLDPGLLYPSVYVEDTQAFEIWRDVVGIAPERIIKLGKDDNFWDHGSGPCGPCSEVYYDRGVECGCGKPDCAPGCDCDRFVEVWNNVFTQFSNDGEGNYSELSQKNIDTGLGLERLACVCQGVDNIFEIDTIKSIVNKVSDISNKPYGINAEADVSIRIITDHMRAATMMICDGVLPSNEGRGYVLRRLLRRAARHGRLLGINKTFLCAVCDVVISESSCAYPDLLEKSDYIKRVIQTEEDSFEKTIDAGLTKLSEYIARLKKNNDTILPGTEAFMLYDTFGFPLDLTVDILAEQNITVDIDSFNEQMNRQREMARKARESLGDLAWETLDLGLDNTPTEFLGYAQSAAPATVLAIVSQDELRSSISQGEQGYIVLDNTPFYAEMGGQSADIGVITAQHDASFEVTDVKNSKSGKYLHYGIMKSGTLSVGTSVDAAIDLSHRAGISRAHSATHLLHKALRKTLGDHVNQAGSLVTVDKLRFDFTHFSALTADELNNIEELVNAEIMSNHVVSVREMPVGEAKKLGATALFGEKYGDVVRVVTIGDSVELCGGTHLDFASRVGLFSILSEYSVASGVRRIEAVTGNETAHLLSASRKQLQDVAAAVKATSPAEILTKVEQNISALREMRSKLESAQSKASDEYAKELLSSAADVGGLKVITTAVNDPGATVDRLRQTGDCLRELDACVVAVLSLNKDNKLTIMTTCGKTAVERGIKAGDLVREVTKICGGSGGGKPDFAMGGGKDVSKMKDAFDFVHKYINEI